MSMYALIDPQGNIVRRKNGDEIDPRQIAGTDGLKAGYKWLPIVTETVDNTTQSENTITTSWSEAVEADRVYRHRTIRGMTAEELQAKADAIEAEKDQQAISETEKALAKIVFVALNEAREANGKQRITAEQFRNQFRSLL